MMAPMKAIAWVVLLAACGDNIEGNRPPEVEPFTLSTQEDLPVTVALIVQDFDLGDVVSAAIAIPPEHGDATITGLSLTYTPGPDYHGNDQFALVVSDGTDEVALTIDVSIASVEDLPFGGEDALATNEDTPRTVPVAQLLANDSDADGDTLTISSVGDPVNGTVVLDDLTGTVTFTPALNFNGNASFIYMLSDGKNETPTTVSVLVGASNDPPVPGDDTATTFEDTPLAIPVATVLANDTDVEGDLLTVTSVDSCVPSCTASLVGDNIEFAPALDFSGVATIEYTVSDGVHFVTGFIEVTVDGAPSAVDDAFTVPPGQTTDLDVLDNDDDPDGGPMTIESVSGTLLAGTSVAIVDDQIRYDPGILVAGVDSFTYTLNGGSTATVTVTIVP
jgi:hypothetical protein